MATQNNSPTEPVAPAATGATGGRAAATKDAEATPPLASGIIFALVAACWTLLILALGGFSYYQYYQSALANAQTAARHSYSKDMTLRHWATEHGGVYAPVTERTAPNPYLSHLPERDIVTPAGRRLTLLNPAYLTRQIHEMADPELGVDGHLTSLNPIRPENAPDAWEEQALRRLSETPELVEITELAEVGPKQFLRMMRTFNLEPACTKCHTGADDKVGEMRGGLSVSVPWEPYRQGLFKNLIWNILGFGGLWLIGFSGIAFSLRRLHQHLVKRWETENHLRRSEEKYRLLAESSEAIPWEFDLPADRWTYVAPQVAKVLGFAPEEWTNLQFWTERIHPEDRSKAVAFCMQETHRGEDHVFEYRFLKKDGSVAWLREVVSVEMAAGQPVRLRGVLVDLSGHHLLEEKLRQSAKMEAVGTLAAGVAHDFNNILTSLISFATLAKRRNREDEVSQDYLQEILDGAKRAAELTRSLLAYSRKQQIELKPEDLGAIVEKNQKMLRRIIRENIEIKLVLAERSLPVMADHVQIEQVLMNLAGNAQDAMPDGGWLIIATGRQEKAPPELGLASSGPWAVLTVTDTGCGIEPAIRERIFDPFFTTKEVGRGTGLGLSMVQGIVQQHGGAMTLASELGRGSTFTIFLPLSGGEFGEPGEPGEPNSSRPNGQKGRGATILLAEDEAQVRKVLQRVMEQQGYRVRLAADGEEALALFRRDPGEIDLVVMDVVMPGRNGQEAGQAMRRLKPELPIILISGYTHDFINSEELARSGFHFLGKPIQPEVLVNKIREILKVT